MIFFKTTSEKPWSAGSCAYVVEECLNVYWCDFDVERKDYLAHQLLPDLGQRMLFIAIHNKRPRVG